MENNPLISILIVAYNPGEYLRNTIKSCLEQTYKNTEILILDNNSNEDISQYFPTNTEDLHKIQLITNSENVGPYKWLNILLKQAKWDYIAIQDHDDIWHPQKLEKQIHFLETHKEYIGCGTKTVMYYEGDQKYFEYYLEKTNFFTVHPSLVFRYDGSFYYDTTRTEYMCDAWSLKYNLCKWEKKIYNLDEALTLHLIKKTSGNYSYRWYSLTIKDIKQTFEIHSKKFAILITGWEIMRKMAYPILNAIKVGKWINPIERIPFRIFGNTIKTTQGDEWWKRYIN